MHSKLPKGGFQVSEDDLTDAPPEVLEFLLNLEHKNHNKTSHQNRQKPERGLDMQQELCELVKSFTNRIHDLTEQYPVLKTRDVLCKATTAMNNLTIGEPLAEKRAELAFSFDPDGREPRNLPISEQLPDSILGTSSTPIDVELLPAEEPGPIAPLPDLSGADSDVIEELVRFGMKNWPDKNFDQFRPGQLVTAGIMYELLRIDLPAEYGLGVPPNRVSRLQEICAGIVMPYHVNEVDQLSELESKKNHFVVAIINKQEKTFTAWGMSKAMCEESRAVYEKSLGFNLIATNNELGNYTGNCCAFRCVEAVRSYFGFDITPRDEVPLRIFFFKQLLESWINASNQAVDVQAPSKIAATSLQSLRLRSQPDRTLLATGHAQSRMAPTDDSFSNIDDQILEDPSNGASCVSPSLCLKLAQTPLPRMATKQARGNKKSRKRLASEVSASIQSPEDVNVESAKLPPKRKHKEDPSPEILAEELTGSGATERIRRHVLACRRDTPVFPKAWDEQGDHIEQTREIWRLAHDWNEKSEFDKLVAVSLRTSAVEHLYVIARSMLKLDIEAPDPTLPTALIDQIFPRFREGRTLSAFRNWLTFTRKLSQLGDYLPFVPFDSKGSITFRHYERLPNKEIQRLRKLLQNSPHAQKLAKVGRAFQDHILKHRHFLWESISPEKLSMAPDHNFFRLLTTPCVEDRQFSGAWYQSHRSLESSKLNLVKQCDLCDEHVCDCFVVGHDLASKQPTLPERPPDTTAPYNNIATGECQTWTAESPSSTSASLQTIVPQFQLALSRTVSDTAESITFAIKGNIDGLEHLFSLGLASPRDISHSRGFSLLRWALYGGHSGFHHYETVQFLLDQGAHVDDESYETVRFYNLCKKYSGTDRQALRRLTRQDRNWFKEQKFPFIHQIIFGMSSVSLAEQLLREPGAVFASDAQGRTALDWATARAQLDDMELLIANGSNPNSMDNAGRTTILHAVDSRDTRALRIVLTAGADPEPQIPKGLFRGNPLTSANLNSLAGMVKLLIEFGAKIDAANPEGLTALHSAAVSQNLECASILLEHGADMDHMSSNGCTPLMTAIIHNSHEILRLFLGKRVGPLNSIPLWPVIAEHADLETMSILASPEAFGLSGDCLPADHAILLCRRKYDDSLGRAFEGLVSVSQCKEKYDPP